MNGRDLPPAPGTQPRGLPGLVLERIWPRPVRGPLDAWVQAVSVGEVEVARTFVAALLARRPSTRLLVTSTTPAGVGLLHQRLGPEGEARALRPFPLDIPFSVARLLDSARPRLLVLVETEIWPVLLSRARRRGTPVLVVNARLSERSLRRILSLGPLFRGALSGLTHVAARTPGDAERFERAGVPAGRIRFVGDLKLDRPRAEAPPFAGAFARLAGGRPVLVAGSVADDEVEAVLTARDRLAEAGTDLLLLLAPRRPDSFEPVAARLEARGLPAVRRSRIDGSAVLRPAVFLLDTVGELAGAYGLGDVAFVGGTLVPKGGHNVLEPLRAGLPVVVGPSIGNVRASVEAAGEAVRVVPDAGALAGAVAALLADEEARRRARAAAEALFAGHGGAADRAAAAAAALIEGRPLPEGA